MTRNILLWLKGEVIGLFGRRLNDLRRWGYIDELNAWCMLPVSTLLVLRWAIYRSFPYFTPVFATKVLWRHIQVALSVFPSLDSILCTCDFATHQKLPQSRK